MCFYTGSADSELSHTVTTSMSADAFWAETCYVTVKVRGADFLDPDNYVLTTTVNGGEWVHGFCSQAETEGDVDEASSTSLPVDEIAYVQFDAMLFCFLLSSTRDRISFCTVSTCLPATCANSPSRLLTMTGSSVALNCASTLAMTSR